MCVCVFVRNRVTFCGTRIGNELFLDSCFSRDLAGVRQQSKTNAHMPITDTIKTVRNVVYTHTETSVPIANGPTAEKTYFFSLLVGGHGSGKSNRHTEVENMSNTTGCEKYGRAHSTLGVRRQQSE